MSGRRWASPLTLGATPSVGFENACLRKDGKEREQEAARRCAGLERLQQTRPWPLLRGRDRPDACGGDPPTPPRECPGRGFLGEAPGSVHVHRAPACGSPPRGPGRFKAATASQAGPAGLDRVEPSPSHSGGRGTGLEPRQAHSGDVRIWPVKKRSVRSVTWSTMTLRLRGRAPRSGARCEPSRSSRAQR